MHNVEKLAFLLEQEKQILRVIFGQWLHRQQTCPLGYPFWKSQERGKKGASYWRHGNTVLPDNKKYNTQLQDDPNKQHFVWGNSSELKSENSKRAVYGDLHVTTKLNLNNENQMCLGIRISIQSKWYRLSPIYIWWLDLIRTSRKE